MISLLLVSLFWGCIVQGLVPSLEKKDEGQNAGDYLEKTVNADVSMSCQGKNLIFGMSLVWTKRQDMTSDTWIPVAHTNILQQDFIDTGRYSISLSVGDMTSTLSITGITVADVGQYRCALHSDTGLKESLTHEVVIYENIESVTLYREPNKTATNKMDYETTNNMKQYFGCVVIGGYPKPVVKVVVGEGENAPRVVLLLDDQTTSLGKPGLNDKTYKFNYYTDKFDAKASYDSKNIHCIAEVLDKDQAVRNIKQGSAVLTLRYSPWFEPVRDFTAMPDDKDVVLAVGVHSNPMFNKVVWRGKDLQYKHVVDSTKVDDSNTPGMSTDTEALGSFMVATLKIDKVTTEHYQIYNVEIYSLVGSNSTTVKLSQGKLDDYTVGGLNNTGSSTSSKAESVLPNIVVFLVPLLLAVLLSALLH